MADENVDPNVVVPPVNPNGQQYQQQQAVVHNPAVNRIQVKVPPFWKQNPELWFKQLEAQFSNSNIVNDLTKFNTIVGVIESDILSFVSDIVLTPPPNNLYNAIKARLIKQFTDSDSKKLHSLLNDLQIGDMKPSNLLRKMRELSCGKVGEDLLKVLWLQKLPTTIQAILSTNTNPLEQLSSLADTMFEVVECSSVQAVSSTQTSQFNDLVNAVYKLDGKIESLKKQFRAPSKSSKTVSRSRTPTPTKAVSVTKGKICFYHKRFATKARKCVAPCNFVAPRKSKN